MKSTYPIKERFVVNGIEFYIDSVCGVGRSGNYSLYCITDHKNLCTICTRGKLNTIIRKIEERANPN